MHDSKGRVLAIGDTVLCDGIVAGLVSGIREGSESCNLEIIAVSQQPVPVGNSSYNPLKVTNLGNDEVVHTYLSHQNFTASDCELVATVDGTPVDSRLPTVDAHVEATSADVSETESAESPVATETNNVVALPPDEPTATQTE